MSSNVVALPEERERRSRNPFKGVGRHRRTPEAWAEMQRENDALRAAKAAAERDSDFLRGQVDRMDKQIRELLTEVRQVRALMAADPHQEKVTIIPPADPEETQPISQAELFKDTDTMASIRPVIRVGEIRPPDTVTSDAATKLVERLTSQSEKVRHVDPTQPIPLWDSPMAQGLRVVDRNTA